MLTAIAQMELSRCIHNMIATKTDCRNDGSVRTTVVRLAPIVHLRRMAGSVKAALWRSLRRRTAGLGRARPLRRQE